MTRRSRRLSADHGRPDPSGQSIHWPHDRDDSLREAVGHRAAVARARRAAGPRAGRRRSGRGVRRRDAGLPGLRCRVSGLRPTSSGVAPSGHDAVPDAGAGGRPAGALRGARRPAGAGAVGGNAVAVHGPVRSDGDRLAEGGELRGRGAAVPVELGPGGGDPGTGGSTGFVAAPGGGCAGGRGGRDVVPTAARVRDGRQRPHDVGAARAVRGGRALPRGPGRLLRGGGRGGLRADPDGGDGHVARLHRVGAQAHGGVDRVRQVPRGAAPGGGGRPGSAVGEPGPAATRRRPAGEDALPVADASRQPDAAATPSVHAVASELVCAWRVRGRSRNWRRGCGTTAPGAGRSGCGGAGTAGRFAVAWSRSRRWRG